MHDPLPGHPKNGVDPLPPRRAAVALLVRNAGAGLELYWVRRSPNLAFLGGFWAFPGGAAESRDGSLAETAVRELQEETGVAVASDRLWSAGRTVTPPWAKIRFDATYFLVEAPHHAEPDVTASGGELVAGEWTTPSSALARWRSGERLTSPVVVDALLALAEGGELSVLAARLTDRLSGLMEHRLWELVPGLAIAALRSPTTPPATHTNCFVVGDQELVIIDPGSPYPEEQAALDESLESLLVAGRRIREIWITHHHADHVGGIAHLVRRHHVPVAAHPWTAERVLGVDRLLMDGERLQLGSRILRVVFTPGHTVGHHCFFEEQTRYVLAGDLVAGVGTVVVDPDEGDMGAYLESLGRLESLTPRALLPAHGPVMTEPAAKLAEYRAHRLWREARIVDVLHGGAASAAELVPAVYSDTPSSVHFLAERSLRAHLVKLVREGRVVLEGDVYRVT